MPWKQTRHFDTSKGGTVKYMCLSNSRKGYEIAARYETASIAWRNTVQHTGAIPAGLAVPVFWDWYGTLEGKYDNYGHVAVRLPDGRIWTDGRYYSSVDELNRLYLSGKGKYLGWGETLNGVRVVEYVADPPSNNPPQGDDEMIENEQQARDAYYMLRGDRPVTDGEIKGTAGKRTWAQFAVTGKPEVKVREADYADAVAQRARIPALERQLAEKPKEVEVIKEVVKEVPVEKRVEVPVDKPETLKRVEELQADVTGLNQENEKLRKQLSVKPTEIVKTVAANPAELPAPKLLAALISKALNFMKRNK